MSLVNEQFEFLKDVCELIEFSVGDGWTVTGGELYRPEAMQKLYLQDGKSKTINSYHMQRLAIDLNFFKNGKLTYSKYDLQSIGNYWESLHPQNSWGGNWQNFVDTPHFERRLNNHD